MGGECLAGTVNHPINPHFLVNIRTIKLKIRVDRLDCRAKPSILEPWLVELLAQGGKKTMGTSQVPQRQLRGSQKLLEGLAKNQDAPSIEEIRKAIALPVDYKVLNWLIRGTPPAYLEWETTLQVSTANLATVVNHFVGLNDSTIGLRILINGIPIPEIANVTITNSGPVE
jgi:hypothetical protein